MIPRKFGVCKVSAMLASYFSRLKSVLECRLSIQIGSSSLGPVSLAKVETSLKAPSDC